MNTVTAKERNEILEHAKSIVRLNGDGSIANKESVIEILMTRGISRGRAMAAMEKARRLMIHPARWKPS